MNLVWRTHQFETFFAGGVKPTVYETILTEPSGYLPNSMATRCIGSESGTQTDSIWLTNTMNQYSQYLANA